MSSNDSSKKCYETAWSNKNIEERRAAVDELARRAEGNSEARNYLEALANRDMRGSWQDQETIGRARFYKKK